MQNGRLVRPFCIGVSARRLNTFHICATLGRIAPRECELLPVTGRGEAVRTSRRLCSHPGIIYRTALVPNRTWVSWASLGRFHLKRADEPPRTPGSRSKIPSQPGHCGGRHAFRTPSGRASPPAGGTTARRPALLPAGACNRLQSRRHFAPTRSVVVRRRTIRPRAGMAHARHPPGSPAGISGKPGQHAATPGTA
jgi:hypothetical protein